MFKLCEKNVNKLWMNDGKNCDNLSTNYNLKQNKTSHRVYKLKLIQQFIHQLSQTLSTHQNIKSYLEKIGFTHNPQRLLLLLQMK